MIPSAGIAFKRPALGGGSYPRSKFSAPVLSIPLSEGARTRGGTMVRPAVPLPACFLACTITLPDAEHKFAMPASQSRLASREHSVVPIMSGMGRSSYGEAQSGTGGALLAANASVGGAVSEGLAAPPTIFAGCVMGSRSRSASVGTDPVVMRTRNKHQAF
jgi:hypothetical protein